MKKLERYLIAVVGGILVTVSSLFIALFGGSLTARLLDRKPPGPPGTNVSGGEMGTVFYLSFGAIALAAGAIFVFAAWNRQARRWNRVILYSLSLLILLSLSGANFLHNDSLVARPIQALVNLALAFVAAVVVLSLTRLRLEAPEASVFRLLAIAVLSALGVALPLLFSTVWLFDSLGMAMTVPKEALAVLASLIGVTTAAVDLHLKSRQLADKHADA